MFGQPNTQSMSAPSFAAQTPASNAPASAAQPQPPVGRLPDALTDLMERQMNTAHADCKFQAALFNKVDPASATTYVRPPGMQENTWRAAVANNPDPSRLAPVPANWFGDLTTRVEIHNERLDAHKETIDLAAKRLAKIHNAVETQVEPRLDALRRRHRELSRRLLNVAIAVEAAYAREQGGGSLNEVERERYRRLETLCRELDDPGKFKARLCDLSDRAKCASVAARGGAYGNLRDERAARAVRNVLTEQLDGIKKLHDICETAKRDVEIVANGLANLS